VTEQRRQLPWVPVEKQYKFDTEDGKKTLAELFDGRSSRPRARTERCSTPTRCRHANRSSRRISLPARANAEASAREAARLAQGRIPGLIRRSLSQKVSGSTIDARRSPEARPPAVAAQRVLAARACLPIDEAVAAEIRV
jgi:Bacterial protein of unknown function (DUF899)